jgi:hypothetical protein
MSRSSLEPGPSEPRGRFIPGVYNYCDRWCERCTLSSRCRVFQHNQAFEAATAAGFTVERALEKAESFVELLQGPQPPVPPSWERQRDAIIEAANRAAAREPTPDEWVRSERMDKRRREWVKAHPLARSSRDYMHLVLDAIPALRSRAGSQADSLAAAALDAIRHHAFLIRSKLQRALGVAWEHFDPAARDLADGDEDAVDDLDEDEEFLLYDANGSAHVALRAIAESREAWEVVAAHPAFASNGMAASMIQRLRDLESDVPALLPGALTFKRPGFDDGAAL